MSTTTTTSTTTSTATRSFEATDISGQHAVLVEDAPGDSSVGDVVSLLLGEMHLPPRDPSGEPISYRARLEREDRYLLDSEVVAEALQPGDRVALHPSIDAGGGAS